MSPPCAPSNAPLLQSASLAVDDAAGKATAPTGPGTFTVADGSMPAPRSATVAEVYYGSGCGKSVAYGGKSGTVTVTSVRADGSLEGTFDVVITCAGVSSCS